MSKTTVSIYGLRESGVEEFRYVGQTKRMSYRLYCHLEDLPKSDNDLNPKRHWIKSVLDNGKSIEMILLDECDEVDAVEFEQKWMDYYLDAGHRLTNSRPAFRARNAGEKSPSIGENFHPFTFRPTEEDAMAIEVIARENRGHADKPLELIRIALREYWENNGPDSPLSRIEREIDDIASSIKAMKAMVCKNNGG